MTDEAKKGDILEVISEVFGFLRDLRKFRSNDEKCILLHKIAFKAFFPELQNENVFLKRPCSITL